MISGKLSVDSGKLYYESKGSGLPVVLIHAGYLDSRMWETQFESFSNQYQVVRYDVRGYGKSSHPTGSYSDAVDLKSLLDHLKIEGAVLIGVSNGGRIALDFAVEYPGRVKALVLINFGVRGYKSSGPEEDRLWGPIIEAEERYSKLVEEGKIREAATVNVDLYSHKLSGEMRERILGIAIENVHQGENTPGRYQVSPSPAAYERLGVLKMPILIIVGSEDSLGDITVNKTVHNLLPSSELVMIEGADHVPSLSKPEEFDNVLSNFLEKIRLRSTK
jgi:pimeloyl-ACP methyl ester carboxylesterase